MTFVTLSSGTSDDFVLDKETYDRDYIREFFLTVVLSIALLTSFIKIRLEKAIQVDTMV